MTEPREVRFVVGDDGYIVSSDDHEIAAALARWSAGLRGETAPMTRVHMRAHGSGAPCLEFAEGRVDHHESPLDLLPALEGMIYGRLMRPNPRRTVIHACALARAGKAVLFCGESGAGKSVLALSLVARGWTYLSDEFAPLGNDGRVAAVPRPVTFCADEIPEELFARISQNRATWSTSYRTLAGGIGRSLFVYPERVARSGEGFPLAAVLRLQRREGAAPRMRRMSGPEMRAWLFAHRARPSS